MFGIDCEVLQLMNTVFDTKTQSICSKIDIRRWCYGGIRGGFRKER